MGFPQAANPPAIITQTEEVRKTSATAFVVSDDSGAVILKVDTASQIISLPVGTTIGSTTAGRAAIVTQGDSSGFLIATGGNNNKGLSVRRSAAGQAVNIFEVQDEAGGVFVAVSQAGNLIANGGITIADATNIALAVGTGTKIGTATGQKLGFWNAAPIVRPAAPALPVATASTNVTPFGYTTGAQADAIVTAVRALITAFSAALGGMGLLS